VLIRDRYRCSVPWCTCKLWIDLHHLKPYAAGGDHSEGNILTICGLHHGMAHSGNFAIWREGDQIWFETSKGRRESLFSPTWDEPPFDAPSAPDPEVAHNPPSEPG
jgi:hypothetical protein